ncbi:MAG: glucose-6-phosphate dehydrogenase [Kiritimatiellia bacterium]
MGDAENKSLSIVVIGASGDLARKKIIPALFALYCQDRFPEDFRIFGFSRTAYTDAAFRTVLEQHLTCRYAAGDSCAVRMEAFLARCHYVAGQYGARDAYLDLFARMQEVESSRDVNRLYYLSIPPSIFLDVADGLGGAGLVQCGVSDPWSRVVIEKPFGSDRASSDELVRGMSRVFREAQTFRIDHYLGKEVIQNLMVLRFANLVFEPLWNRTYIESVQISWKENLSVAGRAGYFNDYGIIRDVMQNHLLEILALTAMEPCAKLDAGHICNEKIRVLRSIKPLELDRIAVGQYTGATVDGQAIPGYLEEDNVPKDSRTPTYAAAVLEIDNERWQGVPFLIVAGKGLDRRHTEIRIRFRPVVGGMFADYTAGVGANELVIRVQPDEGIYLRVAAKIPGSPLRLKKTELDLQYHRVFDELIPDAYESLLLDALRGDKSLFIRKDELAAAWDVFTPVLHAWDAADVLPESYSFGSASTEGARALAGRFGMAPDQL